MGDWAGLGDVLSGEDPQESFENRSLLWNTLVPPDAPEGPDQEELMRLQAELNRVDQETPFGSLTFSGEGDATFELDPRLQQEFEQRSDLRNSLLGNALQRAGQLPTDAFDPTIPEAGQMGDTPQAMDSGQLAGRMPGRMDSSRLAQQIPGSLDYQGLSGRMPTPGGQAGGAMGPMDQSTQAQQAQFERAMSLMRPEFERQGEQTRQRLANRGLPMGGEAYEDEVNRMSQSQDRAMEDAAYRAVQAGNQRQNQLFQQGQADVSQRAGLQGQAFQQGMAGVGQRAGLQGQEFEQGMADVGQRAGLQGQEFQQGMAGFQAQGDRQNQIFQQGMARLGAQQQARQQNLNEIQAMLSGQQVGQNIEGQGQNLGSFFAPSNIDVLGSAGLEQQGDWAEYNAQQNQTQGNLSGLGSIVTSLFCSREYKENSRPVESILPRIDALKVEAWDYKEGYGDEGTHIGPYAEDFRRLFGLGDGKTIPTVDLFGVLILGVQELNRRVEAIEHG